MQHGIVLNDTTPIIFHKPQVVPEVQPGPSPSRNDIQSMINSTLERQAKSTDELLHRLIEEQDGKKLGSTSVNHSSNSYAVSFTQTNPHTSGTSAGGTTMPNSSAKQVNHFHSRTTIKGWAPTFGMLQQTTTNMFGQGYTQTAPNVSMPNFTSIPYTPRGNGRAYTHTSGSFQATYTTVDYTDPIPIPDSSLGYLPNHAYQNVSWFNAYRQLKTDAFGYETLPQFHFRL
jgi:hypothetical protein